MSPVSAGVSGGSSPGYIAQVVMNGSTLLFADHYDHIADGNWIQLSGGDPVRLPDPLSFTYRGVNRSEFHSESLDLTMDFYLEMSGEGDYYKEIVYPYSNYSVYTNVTGKNEVLMDFKGAPIFAEQGVRVYLVKADLVSVFDMFGDFRAANADDFEDLFLRNFEESDYERYPETLDVNGDLHLDLGAKDSGDYGIVVLLDSPDDLAILSATAFKVLPYGMTVGTSIDEKSISSYDLDVSIDLDGPDTSYNYTAVLIEASNYKAELEMESNGARTGTNLSINGRELMGDFDLPAEFSSETDLLDFIGINTENVSNLNSFAADVFGENTQFLKKDGNGNSTSFNFYLENVETPKEYILFTGVWKSGEGLVAFDQKEVTVDKKDDEDEEEKPSNGGGGSSSGGGGGGGGSPEPANNVRIKELAQQFVTNGNRIRFEFIRKATVVDYVEFDAKKSAGKTTTIIEELKGISVLTPAEPDGEIYEHINIWVGNGGFASPENIGGAVIGFRVNKKWIAENEIIESTVTLNRYSEGKWSALQTRKIGEDEGFIYFEASSPGFSPFAVTAENNKLVIEKIHEEAQTPTGTEQPVETDTSETEKSSGEKENTGISKSFMSKTFSFIIGFMVVILMGMAVLEKKKH